MEPLFWEGVMNQIRCCSLLLLTFSSFSAVAQSWPHEPSSANLLTECSFDVTTCPGWLAPSGTGKVVVDASAPWSADSVLEYSIGPGRNSGGGDVTFPLADLDDLYVGFGSKRLTH